MLFRSLLPIAELGYQMMLFSTGTILIFQPEPQVVRWLKHPYDDHFHEVLKTATTRSFRHINCEYVKALVTDRTVRIVTSDPIHLKVISYFTAYANDVWDRGCQLVFTIDSVSISNAEDLDHPIKQAQRIIETLSKVSYEMYLEEHRFDVEGGLFPEYTFLPYEKTPEYYQRGIILTK